MVQETAAEPAIVTLSGQVPPCTVPSRTALIIHDRVVKYGHCVLVGGVPVPLLRSPRIMPYCR